MNVSKWTVLLNIKVNGVYRNDYDQQSYVNRYIHEYIFIVEYCEKMNRSMKINLIVISL